MDGWIRILFPLFRKLMRVEPSEPPFVVWIGKGRQDCLERMERDGFLMIELFLYFEGSNWDDYFLFFRCNCKLIDRLN